MLIQNKNYRSIWVHPEHKEVVCTFDQRRLPFEVSVVELRQPQEALEAIRTMLIRGAPLIGATGAAGMYLAVVRVLKENIPDKIVYLKNWKSKLSRARPTAVNLQWAVDRMYRSIAEGGEVSAELALCELNAILEEEVEMSKMIGLHGLKIIEEISKRKPDGVVNILTHCNAGWIACIDYGTATAPVYMAHRKGIKVHVWVDETRPRNQGARLTAWELSENGIPHHLITDNAGGHLMQHGKVDLVIVGSDRTTRNGDVANKIGTYLKALAAADNDVPFYVALPSSTIDFSILDGIKCIPIEERDEDEVLTTEGLGDAGITKVLITHPNTRAMNYGFDITPARLVTGLITERGLCEATEDGILSLFPENR